MIRDDFPVVLGSVVVIATGFVVINFFVDSSTLGLIRECVPHDRVRSLRHCGGRHRR